MGPLHESNVTPVNERFYLGSASTVRGWQPDHLSPRNPEDSSRPIGGDFTYHLTGEIRRDVWGPVGLILFADAGNVWADARTAKVFVLFPSAGLGIRFLTLVGPLRVDFGYQLHKNPYGESRLGIHLSLGSPF